MLNLDAIKKNIKDNYYKFIARVKETVDEDVELDYVFTNEEDEMTKRIESIKIEKASIFDSTVEDYKYNGLSNTVIINKKYVAREDISLDNLYMDIALCVALYNSKEKISGFGTETFQALNKGFREMLTTSLVGECRSEEYFESDEYVYTNLICRFVDPTLLQEAYFYNKPELFLQDPAIQSKIGEFEKINTLANHNMKNRLGKKSRSELDDIEFKLFSLYLSTEPNKEQLNSFMANIVSSSAVFKDKEKYERLDRLDLNDMYEKYLIVEEATKIH